MNVSLRSCWCSMLACTGMPCGRGRHALRIIARMDSMQTSGSESPQTADTLTSEANSTPRHVWPLAARRGCYSMRREAQRKTTDAIADAPLSTDPSSNAEPPTVWPLAARRRIFRLRRAESAGMQLQDCSWNCSDLAVALLNPACTCLPSQHSSLRPCLL